VDYDFTAAMEDDLDRIANGSQQRSNWLSGFYFGDGSDDKQALDRGGGLKALVGTGVADIDAREINSIPLHSDDAGREVVVRVGRYGPYLERAAAGGDGAGTNQRANLPDTLAPDELTPQVAEKLFATPIEGRSLGLDPDTHHEIVAKEGRFGPFVTEVFPGSETGGKKADKPEKKNKPRTASLFSSMDVAEITLDEALKLLSQPRLLGEDPDTGERITAQNGRYGPYLKRGTDSRSLPDEESIFTVTLEEARKLYAEPKKRGRAAAAPPLKELGNDPTSGKPMVLKDGRFGPYVTDGQVNASLRRSDAVEDVDDARAAELLAERRAKGPPSKGRKNSGSATKKSGTGA
jgi:DNA topoisomerase-1